MLILYVLIAVALAMCTIVLVILKLAGIIACAWGWIFSPIWIFWCVAMIALIVAFVYSRKKSPPKRANP